jgi:hypothetical protein
LLSDDSGREPELVEAAPPQARLHGDPADVAGGGAGAAGAAALGALQEVAAAADGGHDTAPEAALAKAGDASRFAWLPGDERQYDLVVTLDDATSAVYSGFIVA